MNEKVFCEKCGAEMLPIDPNNHVGMNCPKCGWGWATSFIEPIAEDAVDYTVILLAENVPTKETIKTVAGIAGINYLQAGRMIKTAPQKLFVGKAMSVRSVLTALEASSIAYRVEPLFPYSVD